jgi:hypothetical protein
MSKSSTHFAMFDVRLDGYASGPRNDANQVDRCQVSQDEFTIVNEINGK